MSFNFMAAITICSDFEAPKITSATVSTVSSSICLITYFGKVMFLHFNMLSRLVIAFLSRSKRLLISWLQSPSAVILEPQKIKSDTVSPSICHEVMRADAMIFVF